MFEGMAALGGFIAWRTQGVGYIPFAYIGTFAGGNWTVMQLLSMALEDFSMGIYTGARKTRKPVKYSADDTRC